MLASGSAAFAAAAAITGSILVALPLMAFNNRWVQAPRRPVRQGQTQQTLRSGASGSQGLTTRRLRQPGRVQDPIESLMLLSRVFAPSEISACSEPVASRR